MGRALPLPRLWAGMLLLRRKRRKTSPPLPTKAPRARSTCRKLGTGSSLSTQHVSSIIYRPGGAITIHNSRAIMFYKFEPAIWLPGPRVIFPGLPCATSKVSFLLAKRQQPPLGQYGREGHPQSGRVWSHVRLSLLFGCPRASSPAAPELRGTLGFWSERLMNATGCGTL